MRGSRYTRRNLKKRSVRRTRRLLRRLNLKQQRGGAGEPVTSLGAWISAVQKSPSWVSADASVPLRDLAEDVPITLEVSRQARNGMTYTERDEAFEIPGLGMNPADIRRLAPTITEILQLLGVTPSITREGFARQILSASSADPDIALRIQTLVKIENAIRAAAGSDMSHITTLSDSTAYPLFIWYMFIGATPGLVAQEANEGLVPILSTQEAPVAPGE